jgi:hypothetical protein
VSNRAPTLSPPLTSADSQKLAAYAADQAKLQQPVPADVLASGFYLSHVLGRSLPDAINRSLAARKTMLRHLTR